MAEKEYTFELESQINSGEKLAVITYEQDDIGPHDHHFFELAYITGGSASHTLNGQVSFVSQGDYFIVDYGSVHSYTQSRAFTLINCLFLPEIIDDTLAGCRSFDELLKVCLIRFYKQYFGKTPANHIFHDEDGSILKLLCGMQEEWQRKSVGYTEIFRCRLMEILILTMRKIVREDALFSGKGVLRSDVVQEAIGCFDRHFTERAVLRRFCEEYHYSLPYVSRRFRQETGISVSGYLQKLRIEKSCELLLGSSLSIQEIAREAGYEDVKFFNQIFRRLLGMSPREYRRMSLAARW